MNHNILIPEKDPMGTAIFDYYKYGKASKLRVLSSQFDEDEIPVNVLFRSFEQMPALEQRALQEVKGRILDVGAGSGCHSLELQKRGYSVCAIDVSPKSVEVMRLRGVQDARLVNLFDEYFTERFDTVMMLMNGSGIVGRIENLPYFFQRMKLLLNPGGSILLDSSDLKYLYEDEDGSFLVDLAGDYYGQVDFQMKYKNVTGDSFDWLYVDYQTLSAYAKENGFESVLLQEGEHCDYLAKLILK